MRNIKVVVMNIVIFCHVLLTYFGEYLSVAWKYTGAYVHQNLVARHMMIHPLLQRKFQEMRG